MLSKSEWGSFVPTSASAAAEATDLQKVDQVIGKVKVQKRASITTPFIKNAACYVDVKKGDVLLPSRVDRYANYEIQGLTWSLEHTRPLMQILSDEKKWKPFAESVRQTPGAHLSIGKDVLTPQKRALRIIKKLPETATWDQIQKKIEAAVKADDEHREIS